MENTSDVELPARKKRRSWKQHKVDAVELCGTEHHHDMYACDQCDKMFGKQSSLARHKYEHSGELMTVAYLPPDRCRNGRVTTEQHGTDIVMSCRQSSAAVI